MSKIYPRSSTARPRKTPPHVSLRNLRRASKLSLDDVCEALTETLGLPPEKPFTRGGLSAIEGGLRGPSQDVLDALAVIYGLDPGDIVTDYEPRQRELRKVSGL